MSSPRWRIAPLDGPSIPESRLNKVVLPAPFGPMKAVMPFSIANDSGARAWRPWNAFDRFSTARIMSAGAVSSAGASLRFARHPDEAAGLAREPSARERGRTQHRIEQRLVARPIRHVPLPVHVHDEDFSAVGIISRNRRDVRSVPIAGQHALIEI